MRQRGRPKKARLIQSQNSSNSQQTLLGGKSFVAPAAQGRDHLQFINKAQVCEPYENIKVDNFLPLTLEGYVDPDAPGTNLIFILSHMHSDHLKGLYQESGRSWGGDQPLVGWDYGKIYCSVVTYRMMLIKFPNLSDYLIPVQLNEEVVIDEIPPRKVRNFTNKCQVHHYYPQDNKVRIRFIDANHCPGAVVIVITGPLGTVVHTGDFRYNYTPMLNDLGPALKVDTLYMDNTFSTPEEDFPCQAEAFGMLRDKIESMRRRNSELDFIIYCYSLGKEEVFVNLSKHFKTKIIVTKERYRKLEAIGIAQDYFITREEQKRKLKQLKQTNPSAEALEAITGFIYVKMMNQRPPSKVHVDQEENVVHFILTGWRKEYNMKHPRYFKIPYSSHSSHGELRDFVKALRPRKLVFNLKQFISSDRAVNFMCQLTSYTEEGKDTPYIPTAKQGKLPFGASSDQKTLGSFFKAAGSKKEIQIPPSKKEPSKTEEPAAGGENKDAGLEPKKEIEKSDQNEELQIKTEDDQLPTTPLAREAEDEQGRVRLQLLSEANSRSSNEDDEREEQDRGGGEYRRADHRDSNESKEEDRPSSCSRDSCREQDRGLKPNKKRTKDDCMELHGAKPNLDSTEASGETADGSDAKAIEEVEARLKSKMMFMKPNASSASRHLPSLARSVTLPTPALDLDKPLPKLPFIPIGEIATESLVPSNVVDHYELDLARQKAHVDQMLELKKRRARGEFKNLNKLGQKNKLESYFSSQSSSCSIVSVNDDDTGQVSCMIQQSNSKRMKVQMKKGASAITEVVSLNNSNSQQSDSQFEGGVTCLDYSDAPPKNSNPFIKSIKTCKLPEGEDGDKKGNLPLVLHSLTEHPRKKEGSVPESLGSKLSKKQKAADSNSFSERSSSEEESGSSEESEIASRISGSAKPDTFEEQTGGDLLVDNNLGTTAGRIGAQTKAFTSESGPQEDPILLSDEDPEEAQSRAEVTTQKESGSIKQIGLSLNLPHKATPSEVLPLPTAIPAQPATLQDQQPEAIEVGSSSSSSQGSRVDIRLTSQIQKPPTTAPIRKIRRNEEEAEEQSEKSEVSSQSY